MSDWQASPQQHTTIGSWDVRSGHCPATHVCSRVSASVNTWPAVNRAILVPVEVQDICTAYQFAFEVTTQSGNCDVGIYDEAGNRKTSMGSTAVAAAGVQVIDIPNVILTPGVYFLAMVCDNVTAAFRASTTLTALQIQTLGQQMSNLGSVTLPDPITFANPANTFTPGIYVSTMRSGI
jgi:hypothetical protein